MDYKVEMSKNIKLWLAETLISLILYLLMFNSFIENNNFLTIIYIILISVTIFIFYILRKKYVVVNESTKLGKSDIKIIPALGMIFCVVVASYARYKIIEKNFFYIVFCIISVVYIILMYKNIAKS
ncbi:hypothetical protein [Clostridium tetanomorphum]|nr:hypothetical protein [Clostridium tetanomorphum]MBP1866261.1 cation transport ATPase [Clostridium tetanomorphum]NRZ95995.1 cation transport ATPase [Clostridium tetanomorphum]